MTRHDAVRRGLERAEVILDEACCLQSRGSWNLVVRRSQEVVELALKSALRFVGQEVPRVHDVGPLLVEHAHRFDAAFQRQIPRLVSASRSLRGQRETSFYGDEASGLPPEVLYSETDAAEALAAGREVIDAWGLLIRLPGEGGP